MPIYMKLEGKFQMGDGSVLPAVRIYCGNNPQEVKGLLKLNIPPKSVATAILEAPRPGKFFAIVDRTQTRLLNFHPGGANNGDSRSISGQGSGDPVPTERAIIAVLIGLLLPYIEQSGKVLLGGLDLTPGQLASYQTGGVSIGLLLPAV